MLKQIFATIVVLWALFHQSQAVVTYDRIQSFPVTNCSKVQGFGTNVWTASLPATTSSFKNGFSGSLACDFDRTTLSPGITSLTGVQVSLELKANTAVSISDNMLFFGQSFQNGANGIRKTGTSIGVGFTTQTYGGPTATFNLSPLTPSTANRMVFSFSNGGTSASFTAQTMILTYFATITSILQASNPGVSTSISGGETVNMVGSGFANLGTPKCRFGSIVVSATVTSATTMTCVAPAQAAAGTVNLAVSMDGISFTTESVSYTYQGAVNSGCPNSCSGRGVCLPTNLCQCSTGFAGADCSQLDCSSLNNCNFNNGSCVGPNQCNCFSGWSGTGCSIPLCVTLLNCNSQGTCVSPNVCSCQSGFNGAKDCGTFSCDNVTCTGNFVCAGPNVCGCKPGKTGEFCNETIFCPSLNNCNNGGVCIDNSTCACDNLHGGNDCGVSLIVAPGLNPALVAGPVVAALVVLIVVVVIVAVIVSRRRKGRGKIKIEKPDFTAAALNTNFPAFYVSKQNSSKFPDFIALLADNDHELLRAILASAAPTEIDDMAKAAMILGRYTDKDLEVLKLLVSTDVHLAEGETTLFRLNSISTKCFSNYVRFNLLEYLWKTLAYVLVELKAEVEDDKVIESKDLNLEEHQSIVGISLEMDPNKTSKQEDLTLNKLRLQLVTQKIFHMIFTSAEKMPPNLREILLHIRTTVEEKFPKAGNKSIGAFLFLRLFCAVVTAPHVYAITKDPPAETTQRYLILISKIMTSVANETLPGQKEQFMADLKDFIIENQGRLRTFYDSFASASNGDAIAPANIPKSFAENSLCYFHTYLANSADKVKVSKATMDKLVPLLDEMGPPSERK